MIYMKVIFVCHGNTCRSPMAEAIFKSLVNDVEVLSAGISAAYGDKAAKNAITVCGFNNLDLNQHETKRFSDLEIEEEIVDDCFPANWDMDEKTRLVLKPRITPDGIIDEYLPESCGNNEMWDPLNDVIYSADGKELKNCVNIKIRKYEVLKGTETIMKNAFHGIFMPAEGDWCYLEEIVLPSSIKSLDVDVFEQCPDLKKIIVPIGQAQRFASMLPRYKEIIIESI